MISARLAALAGTVILALAAGLPAALAADPGRVEARFEIFGLAGLHVLTTRTTATEGPNRYAITMDIDTRGLARVFVDLTSHSAVYGTFNGDVFQPDAYRSEVARNGIERDYGLDYRSDGAAIGVGAAHSADSLVLAAAERVRDTVDQLTAYFRLEHQLARRGTCALVVPVFDGAGLYDLLFSDLKEETLSADGHQRFAGPTRVCEVVRGEIVDGGGHEDDTYRRGRMWYARLTQTDWMIPVRMEYDTAFGTVRGYLAELQGPGVHLRLTGD
jgi:Protein of unknown function (DUF3108)